MDTPVSQDLEVLYRCAPPGLNIASVTKNESKIIVSGQAPSMESVIAFAATVNASGEFTGVTITSLGEAGAAGTASAPAFTVEVAQ